MHRPPVPSKRWLEPRRPPEHADAHGAPGPLRRVLRGPISRYGKRTKPMTKIHADDTPVTSVSWRTGPW
eukprot:4306913-Pyramimonas_sp.AAC.1